MQIKKVVETKICKQCGVNFDITDRDLEFYDKISPSFPSSPGLKVKYQIPSPTLCPDCRQQRRLSFRNERKLYKRLSDASGKQILSIFSEDKPYKIYSHEEFYLNNWDPLNYCPADGFDFSKGFFEQFDKLLKLVPKRAVTKGNALENCDYVNGVGSSKNCYLLFDSSNSENCYYGISLDFSLNCIDGYNMKDCTDCYELIDCIGCYNCYFSEKSINCKDSYYLYNCQNCQNCFGCVNLSNKSFYIFNELYSEKEYFDKINKLKDTLDFKDKFKKFKLKFPHISNIIVNSENVSGDYIYNSKDVYDSFEIKDSNNVRYSTRVYGENNDIVDTFKIIQNCSKIYDSGVIYKNCFGVYFSIDCWKECQNIFYSTESKALKNSFGCHGLTDKSYCILNKQYTKEEYETIVPKIIEHMKKTGEWGEFFPSSISLFGYNETTAIEHYPLSKSEVLKRGWKWKDDEDKQYSGVAYEPKNISEYNEKIVSKVIAEKNIKEILNGILKCEITKKAYKIIKQELEFYIKHSLPIPKRHPDQRHLDRMKLRNPRKLYERNCDKCGIEIKTTYNLEREEIIYCENCYNKEIL